jgi:hypothetical protein
MAPWADTTFFDICARTLLRGEVLYREVFLHGPPGMVLILAAIRHFLGWSYEALCAVDLVCVATIVALLVTLVQPGGFSRAGRLWAAIALMLFYFGTSEWCHCQPDMWMLVPALLALWLRQQQVVAIAFRKGVGGMFLLRPGLEGALWGTAFLMKPFVAVPAVLTWLVGAALVLRRRKRALGLVFLDGLATCSGGFLIIGLAAGWLWRSGNWPYFIQAMEWNDEYFWGSESLMARTERMLKFAFFADPIPMGAIHLVAVPAAIATIVLTLVRGRWAKADTSREPQPGEGGHEGGGSAAPALIASFYLAWTIQANYLQRQFDYHMVPAILLGIALLAGQRWFWRSTFVQFIVLPACLIVPAVEHPLFRPFRVALWPRCVCEGSTPQLRDWLGLEIHQVANPSWQEMEPVATYLRDHDVRDRELTCYGTSAVSLYMQLDVKPSTRYVLLWAIIRFFPTHLNEIRANLIASPQRFAVCDERDMPLSPGSGAWYPWSEPVVFRSGRYQIRRIRSVQPLRIW